MYLPSELQNPGGRPCKVCRLELKEPSRLAPPHTIHHRVKSETDTKKAALIKAGLRPPLTSELQNSPPTIAGMRECLRLLFVFVKPSEII